MNKNVYLLLLLIACCFNARIVASAGTLDTTFNPSGIQPGAVTTLINSVNASASGLAVQSDGKIVVIGLTAVSTFALTRYNSNGSLDLSFGGGTGIVITAIGDSAAGRAVKVQSDGKIVAVGQATVSSAIQMAVVRYNPDGTLDSSFGGGTGIVLTPLGSGGAAIASDVVVQPDGHIVVGGYASDGQFKVAVVRYNIDGTLDTTFGAGAGFVLTAVGTSADSRGIVLQPDGKIVVTGFGRNGADQILTVRYNSDGSLDTTFNGTGMVVTPAGPAAYGYDIALQSDGRLVVAGFNNDGNLQFVTVRYNSDGTVDTTFNGTGIVITAIGDNSAAFGVVVQSDGKIVVAGLANDPGDQIAVVRYTSNGILDTTFNSGGTQPGIVTTLIGGNPAQSHGIALQADGKIVVAGIAEASPNQFVVVRYLSSAVTPTPNDPTSLACSLRLINKYGPRL